ncbi:FGGY family carbohydrate kinase [Streptomyces sp. NBC_01186]|uniref:FGGY-family carbohydrate kinase n=1 Tax=Streptomyces sp. NBC_01186 TaxID=2903765 RepID=UPI002E12AB46|nr:FGGY family carbohydrate kinase [Streptomyces sp. NBC_01186]
MSTSVVMGVDVGSTETKALVLDRAGHRLAIDRRRTPWRRNRDGGADIEADVLTDSVLSAIVNALRQAEATVDAATVEGIAFTGMAESGVLLGGDGRPAAPVIAWFDPRGGEELAAWPVELADEFSGRTGLPLSPLCSAAKLLWLTGQGHDLSTASHWLSVPEYLAHFLGAPPAAEPSLLSRTGLLDQATGKPWTELLEALGAPAGLLPESADAGKPLGTVRADRAPDALRGAVVTVAGHDHPVASVGAHAADDGHLFDSCGTSEALMRVISEPLADDQRRRLTEAGLAQGMHLLPNRWILLGGTRGGLMLGRTLRMLGLDHAEGRARLDADLAGSAQRPAHPPLRVHGAHAAATDIVLALASDDISPADVWDAALRHAMTESEAVIAAMEREVPAASSVTAAGGWTRMSSFRNAKATSLPATRFADVDQPSAFGAAVIAEWATRGRTGELAGLAAEFTHPDHHPSLTSAPTQKQELPA